MCWKAERTFTQTLEKPLNARHWEGKHHTGILTGFLKNTRAVQNKKPLVFQTVAHQARLHNVNQLLPVRWMANQRPHSKAEELERSCLRWKMMFHGRRESATRQRQFCFQKVSTPRNVHLKRLNTVQRGTWGPQARSAAQTCVKVRMCTAAPQHCILGLERGAVQGLHRMRAQAQESPRPADSHECLTGQVHSWVQGALSTKVERAPSGFLL